MSYLPYTLTIWPSKWPQFFSQLTIEYHVYKIKISNLTKKNSIIQNIADQKPKVRYILALDDSKSTLKQITRAVSKNLGTGKFKPVAKEDALLNKEMSVRIQN